MSILKTIDQYKHENLYFCDTIKNNVMPNGNFIRVLYCNDNFTMNGVYLQVEFNDVECNKFYQKHKLSFDIESHDNIIQKIVNIEKTMLSQIEHSMKDKTPQYKITEQVSNGCIKLHLTEPLVDKKKVTLLFKISGIWETEQNYGLTYKFSRVECIDTQS